MPRPTALPILKALGLLAILGGALYGGQAWLNSGPEVAAPGASSPPNGDPVAGPTTSGPAFTSTPGRQSAKDVAQAYASDRQAADARFKGQRMQVHGVVNSIEPGQGQVLLITLGAPTTRTRACALWWTPGPRPLPGRPWPASPWAWIA